MNQKFKIGDRIVSNDGKSKGTITGTSLAGETYSVKIDGVKTYLPTDKAEAEFKLADDKTPTPPIPTGGVAKL